MNLSELRYDPKRALLRNLPPISEWEDLQIYTPLEEAPLTEPIEAYAARDTYPIPDTDDREGYHTINHGNYWFSGLKDYLLTKERCRKLGLDITADTRVFELGCASGRVLRHFAIQGGCQCQGAEINPNHVQWTNTYLPGNVTAFDSTIYPPLPVRDSAYDVCYAVSVFTHMEHFETAWLMELARITKPGGLVFVTIHSDRTWREIHDTFLYLTLQNMKHLIPQVDITPELFQQPMPLERYVIRMEIGTEVYNTNVFHDVNYIRRTWSRFMDIVDIIPKGHEYHDVVVMRVRE